MNCAHADKCEWLQRFGTKDQDEWKEKAEAIAAIHTYSMDKVSQHDALKLVRKEVEPNVRV